LWILKKDAPPKNNPFALRLVEVSFRRKPDENKNIFAKTTSQQKRKIREFAFVRFQAGKDAFFFI
jgi:hypothetical protein